jgi:hypothetical protein
MYMLIVVALMFVLPIASTAVDLVRADHAVLNAAIAAAIVEKWFVFWAVGMRLSTAGLRQILQPRFTAKTILGIDGSDALVLVRELGFANTAIGIVIGWKIW